MITNRTKVRTTDMKRKKKRKKQNSIASLEKDTMTRFEPSLQLPSVGLTLIVGTQKWGFSCKVQRPTPADIFLNESFPSKTPLRTPCSWPP